MNVFEAVKQNVTTRQAAELYGIRVGRNGMAVCPFHNDKNPSMKVDKRFHCFACQADGDVIDFVSRLFGLPSKEAAMKIADDFGISYDSRQKPSIRPKIREPTPEQKYQQEENHCYKVLSDYFHLLRKWEKQYAPQQSDEVWHPLFVEALQRKSHVEYQLDVLLYGTSEEKKALVGSQERRQLPVIHLYRFYHADNFQIFLLRQLSFQGAELRLKLRNLLLGLCDILSDLVSCCHKISSILLIGWSGKGVKVRLPIGRVDIHIADGIAAVQHFSGTHIQPHMGDAGSIIGALKEN